MKLETESLPSPEFIDGEIPLEYRYTFPGGEEFRVRQDDSGKGIITLEKDGRIVFDFASLLPEQWRFVTPIYFKKHPDRKWHNMYIPWTFNLEHKLIMLGDFKTPQDILGLLHEMGHAESTTMEDLESRHNCAKQAFSIRKQGKAPPVSLEEEYARITSKIERLAWAWAVRIMKDIQAFAGVNLRSLFPKFANLKKYINDQLATYRRDYEHIITSGEDEDFYKKLQTYFDRWQYEKPGK